MGLPELKEALSGIIILPPGADLSKALSIASEAKSIERLIVQAQRDARIWKKEMIEKLNVARTVAERLALSMDEEQIKLTILPELEATLKECDAQIDRLSFPLSDRLSVIEMMAKWQVLPTQQRRYMRKLLTRIDSIRKLHRAGFVELRDATYGLLLDVDPDARGGQAFDDVDELISHLKS